MIKNIAKKLLFIIVFFSIFANGQSNLDFTILADKAFEKLYQNPDDCISYSQSILNSDKNEEHSLILKNIIGQAYAMKGDFVQSVNISSPLELEKANDLLFQQLYNNYNLADKYQNLGLYEQSQKIISKILEVNKAENKEYKTALTLAKIHQLQSINFAVNRDYKMALFSLKKSNELLNFKSEENKIIKLENLIFESSFLLRTGKNLESKKIIDAVIYDLEKTHKYPFLNALAYENRAKIYFLQEDYSSSILDLEKALSGLGTSSYNVLKTKIYESLSKNYLAIHNDEKYHFYNKLYTDSKTATDFNVKEGIRHIVKQVESSENNSYNYLQKKYNTSFWIVGFLLILAISSLLLFYNYLKNQNKDLNKQLVFLGNQKSIQQNIPLSTIVEEKTVEIRVEKDPTKISKEKEDEILKKLEQWEISHEYLNKNMSLALLSTQMEVNSKYLSEVIKNKGKNFNGYINELRINRIAYLLKTEPTFLNYKVSYLAEYCGFSSHSAFTTVFKSVTGMSPNIYIQEISKSKNNEKHE